LVSEGNVETENKELPPVGLEMTFVEGLLLEGSISITVSERNLVI